MISTMFKSQSKPSDTISTSAKPNSLSPIDIAMQNAAKKLETDAMICKAISIAVQKFETGVSRNNAFVEKVRKDEVLQKEIRSYHLQCYVPIASSFQYKDDDFPSYPANKIPDSQLIAAVGPSKGQVARLFQNTVFNKTHPVKEIISLGYSLSNSSNMEKQCDFYEYFSVANTQEEFYSRSPEASNSDVVYRVISTDITGKMVSSQKDPSYFPEDIIVSTLTIMDSDTNNEKGQPAIKSLHVTLYPIQDSGWIDLNDKISPHSFDKSILPAEKRKKILWDLFKKSLTEPVLIHCKAGLGRTGHLVLTFELLKHYHEITQSHNPQLIANEILKVLDRIRLARPGLVSSIEQFTYAIRNADSLYRFALEMKYIQLGEPIYLSALKSESVEAIDRQTKLTK